MTWTGSVRKSVPSLNPSIEVAWVLHSQIRILNRIMTSRREGISHNADHQKACRSLAERHVWKKRVEVSTPPDRSSKHRRNRSSSINSEKEEEIFSPSAATKYRGMLARMNNLAQDKGYLIRSWSWEKK